MRRLDSEATEPIVVFVFLVTLFVLKIEFSNRNIGVVDALAMIAFMHAAELVDPPSVQNGAA